MGWCFGDFKGLSFLFVVLMGCDVWMWWCFGGFKGLRGFYF